MSPAIEVALQELDEQIEQAREDAAESHKVAMNSYGAGYDAGYLKALVTFRDVLSGEQER